MLTRFHCLLCTLLLCFVASTVTSQTTLTEFQKALQDKAPFETADFNALQRNQPVVRLAPVTNKREIAVAGLINIRSGAEEFLRSYREGMVRRNNPAILEIGSFGSQPALTNLDSLTLE